MAEKRTETTPDATEIVVRGIYFMFALVSAAGFVKFGWYSRLWSVDQIISEHTPAITGLRLVMAAATALIGLLRALEGPFYLDLLGLRVTGAAATLFSWLACVLGLAFSVRILW